MYALLSSAIYKRMFRFKMITLSSRGLFLFKAFSLEKCWPNVDWIKQQLNAIVSALFKYCRVPTTTEATP